MTEEVKKRGRKKGSKTGPRPIIYVLVSSDKNGVVSKKYSSTTDISVEELKKDFYTLFNVTDCKTFGPFYDVKGLMSKSSSKDDDEDDVMPDTENLDKNIGQGKTNGWMGQVFSLKGKDDVVFFVPESEVIPSGKKTSQAFLVQKDKVVFLQN